jgi:hypothetical protein
MDADPDRIITNEPSDGTDRAPSAVTEARLSGPVLFHDFDAVAPVALSEPEAPVLSGAPVVVVAGHRRSAGWWPLVPPLMLASLSLALLVAHATRDHREGPSGTYVVTAGPVVPGPSNDGPAQPLSLEVKVIPSPPAVVEPGAAERAGRPLPDVVGLVRPDVAALPAAPARPPAVVAPMPEPEPDPLPTTEDAVALIAREARQRRIERERAEELMARQPEMERDRLARDAEDLALLRRTYRASIESALNRLGDRAAGEIWRLTEQSAREPNPGDEARIAAELASRKGRLDRAGRIAIFRANRLPEPLILAELVRDQMKRQAERGGPRSRGEAILRAARQLLDVPPTADDDVQLTASGRPVPRNAQ